MKVALIISRPLSDHRNLGSLAWSAACRSAATSAPELYCAMDLTLQGNAFKAQL